MSPFSASAQTGEEADLCQEHCVHPEHVLAVRRLRLPADQAKQVAALFAVLADPTRLQVVSALLQAQAGELCVCDLAQGLGRDETTISHQLRVLRHQQVVATRKVGWVVYYRLIDEHIRQVLLLGIAHAIGPCCEQVEGSKHEDWTEGI